MVSRFKIYLGNPLLPLYMLILLDHMGLGIIFPILVPIFMDSNGILGPEAPDLLKSFWYSATLSIFPIAMFFGATVLGGLSDQLGRKKVLMICLLGAAVGYALSGLAVDTNNLYLLIFSRGLAGLTAGSMPIAQAAVIDISDDKNKAGNIGLVILAASFGFLFGPLVGGFFANTKIVSWFSYSTPLYFSSLMAVINLVLLRLFQETFIPKKVVSVSLKQSLSFIVDPFRTKSIRFLASIYLLMQLGWSFYFQFIAVYLLKKYDFTSQHIALFMSLMGFGFALGSGWIPRLIAQYLRDNLAALGCLAIATLSILATVSDIHISIAWFASFALGVTMAAAYSIMIKLFSNSVSEEKQGWIMGVSEAIVAVTWAITPLLSSYLENVAISIPLVFSMGLLLISTIMLIYWKPVRLEIAEPTSDL